MCVLALSSATMIYKQSWSSVEIKYNKTKKWEQKEKQKEREKIYLSL